jgi:hypothetical protein
VVVTPKDSNLAADTWILGKDYSQAPTCATCHMSGNLRNGGKMTHDPGERISWTNRPAISLVMDTDAQHRVVTELDPAKRGGSSGWWSHGSGCSADRAGSRTRPRSCTPRSISCRW